MAKYPVSEAKEQQLLDKMEELGILEEDLVEKFILGSGSGGQKINKTSSCVQLIYKPAKIELRCQRTRSQSLNRYYARKELCDQLEEQIMGVQSKKRQEQEKIKRQKRRRSRRAKEKMLKDKKQQSQIKELRKSVTESD